MSLTFLMTKEITSLPENATVLDAAKYMTDMNVGSVIITDGKNKPVGILTDRDIVTKVIANEKEPKSVKVKDIMTSPVTTINVEKDIIDATRLMAEHWIRRLPVVDQTGKVVGVMSLDDILIFLGQEIQNIANALKREIGK
jgi:predicted transcriptional regulator